MMLGTPIKSQSERNRDRADVTHTFTLLQRGENTRFLKMESTGGMEEKIEALSLGGKKFHKGFVKQ